MTESQVLAVCLAFLARFAHRGGFLGFSTLIQCPPPSPRLIPEHRASSRGTFKESKALLPHVGDFEWGIDGRGEASRWS